jgi:hypothetical protein
LEIPVWMFDRAVCVSEVRFAVDAFVDLEALGALSALLDQVFTGPCAAVAPDWPDLPEDARETLIGLMTRLILEHAQAVAAPTMAEAGHDR